MFSPSLSGALLGTRWGNARASLITRAFQALQRLRLFLQMFSHSKRGVASIHLFFFSAGTQQACLVLPGAPRPPPVFSCCFAGSNACGSRWRWCPANPKALWCLQDALDFARAPCTHHSRWKSAACLLSCRRHTRKPAFSLGARRRCLTSVGQRCFQRLHCGAARQAQPGVRASRRRQHPPVGSLYPWSIWQLCSEVLRLLHNLSSYGIFYNIKPLVKLSTTLAVSHEFISSNLLTMRC